MVSQQDINNALIFYLSVEKHFNRLSQAPSLHLLQKFITVAVRGITTVKYKY